VRIGLIMRTALPERPHGSAPADLSQAPAGNTAVTLFPGLAAADGSSLAYTRALDDAKGEQLFRYRTLELTVPLRNNLLLP